MGNGMACGGGRHSKNQIAPKAGIGGKFSFFAETKKHK
jgi:hypothetical protein